MMSSEQIQSRARRLDHLERRISRRPMTAKQVSALEGVTVATAHAWIKILLRQRSIRLAGRIRGSSGGWAKLYGPVVTR